MLPILAERPRSTCPTPQPGSSFRPPEASSKNCYAFHVHHGHTELDRKGEELPDKHAAWREATVTPGQILQGLDGTLRPYEDGSMEVEDELQNPLYTLRISAEKPK
ncbi:DUF6894 family protein [Bradyrhizobium japonicum]|uniref:DUF6894 family protein n=1 Tax=Bradyrhizobium japonicum TaxID=375 RepID=UPI003F7397D4